MPDEKSVQVKSENRLVSLINKDEIKNRFKEVLGSKAAAFMSSVISAYNGNQYLKECDPMSVISAAMISATLDLPINPSLGFAHIVPYSGTAQFQIGWKGFVQLAMRTGQYKTMNVTPICEGELVEYNKITGDVEFNTNRKTSEKVIGYVAYFRLVSGFEKYLYLTKEEVLAHGKRYSASFKRGKGLWVDDFEAMALKTTMKMLLSKWGILSVEMQKAMVSDQGTYEGIDSDPKFLDNPPKAITEAETSSTRLKNAIAENRQPGEEG